MLLLQEDVAVERWTFHPPSEGAAAVQIPKEQQLLNKNTVQSNQISDLFQGHPFFLKQDE